MFNSFQIFLRMFKGEFTKEKFKFNYTPPEDFTICYWQKHTRVLPIYLAFRLALVVYFFITMIIMFFRPIEGRNWNTNLIYFSFWSYTLETTTFSLGFGISLERLLKTKKDPELPPMEKLPAHYKVLWAFYTITAPSAVVATILYWLFLFGTEKNVNIGFLLVIYVFNSLFIILDFFIGAMPYRFLHIYLPIGFSAFYTIFTIIFQFSGGTKNQTPIYRILDWRYGGKALMTCTMELACVGVVHAAFCVMNIMKHWLKKPSDTEQT